MSARDDEARSLHAWDKRIAVLAERDALRAALADVADLCRPTRADDVLRLTDTERLQRIAGRIQAGEPDAR